MANARKTQPKAFYDAPEVQIDLSIRLADCDVVSIGSGQRQVMLNIQEAMMLHDWLTKALAR